MSRSARSTTRGWQLAINLAGTDLEAREDVEHQKTDRSEHDWLHWWVAGGRFEAACGPTNLGEAIRAFLDFAHRPEDS